MLRLLVFQLFVASVVPAVGGAGWTSFLEPHTKIAATLAEQPYLDNHPNPRYTLIETTPGVLLDFNDNAVLYHANDAAHIRFRDGGPDVLIPVANAFLSTQSSFLTPLGAVVVNDDFHPSVHEYSGETSVHPDVRSVSRSGDFAVFISPVENRSFLRNLRANTNLAIPQPLFSAAVTSNGIVYMSAFNTPAATNTTLYKFASGELTQLDSETNHVHGKIQTDGTNVLWFTAPFTLDSNGFQIHLLTPTDHVHLATNYVPPYSSWIDEPGLAQVNNGWTIFPTLDARGTNQIWRRSPEGAVTQATSFPQHTVPFTLRSDGSFVALVWETQWIFGNHLYLITPDAPPLDLGRRYATDYRFVGDELVAFHESFAFTVDLTHRNPTRIYLPIFDSSGRFTCYVTSSQETSTFVFQHSTDLQNWSDISTNLTAAPQPQKFELAAPAGFIRTRQ